jgi:KUP system potassium uptake protein
VLNRVARRQMPMRDLLAAASDTTYFRAPGTAVYLNSSSDTVPGALQRVLETQRTLHQRVVLLTIERGDVPRTEKGRRVTVRELAPGLHRVVARCGFMETPNVPALLREAEREGLAFHPAETQYVLGRKDIVVTRAAGMPKWRKRLYAFMSRNAHFAAQHYSLPPARVTEIGEQIDI